MKNTTNPNYYRHRTLRKKFLRKIRGMRSAKQKVK